MGQVAQLPADRCKFFHSGSDCPTPRPLRTLTMIWHYVLRHGVVLAHIADFRGVTRRLCSQSELDAFFGGERSPCFHRLSSYLPARPLDNYFLYAPPPLDPHNFIYTEYTAQGNGGYGQDG